MKTFINHLAGLPQRTRSAYGIRFASDSGLFLLLALSLIAAIASVLLQGLSGMDEGLRGMLTHGLVILNGGEIPHLRAYL